MARSALWAGHKSAPCLESRVLLPNSLFWFLRFQYCFEQFPNSRCFHWGLCLITGWPNSEGQCLNYQYLYMYFGLEAMYTCYVYMYTCFAFLPKNVYMLCCLIMEVSPPIIALSCPYHFWRLASTNSFYSLFLIVSKFQHRLPNPKYPYFISCGCACLNDQIVVAEESQIANKIWGIRHTHTQHKLILMVKYYRWHYDSKSLTVKVVNNYWN